MTANIKIINSNPSSEGFINFSENQLKNYGNINIKDAPPSRIKRDLKYPISSVIQAMQDVYKAPNNKARVYVRGQWIEPHNPVCIPGWHVDAFRDLNKRNDKRFIIWSNIEGTEFLVNPFCLIDDQVTDFAHVIDPSAVLPYSKAKEGELISYTQHNYHRGPIPTRSGYRMMIRMTV